MKTYFLFLMIATIGAQGLAAGNDTLKDLTQEELQLEIDAETFARAKFAERWIDLQKEARTSVKILFKAQPTIISTSAFNMTEDLLRHTFQTYQLRGKRLSEMKELKQLREQGDDLKVAQTLKTILALEPRIKELEKDIDSLAFSLSILAEPLLQNRAQNQ